MLQLVLPCMCTQAHAGTPIPFLGSVVAMCDKPESHMLLLRMCLPSHRLRAWERSSCGFLAHLAASSASKESLKKQERTIGAVGPASSSAHAAAPKAVRNGETMTPSAMTEAWTVTN